MTPTEVAAALLDRMNHIEDVLVSSLLGFVVTATLSIFAAIYYLRAEAKIFLRPLGVFWGVAAFYTLLSGYYYFMLTHFYAVATVLLEYARESLPDLNLGPFWTFFQVPVGNNDVATGIGLASAPLFPFLFSSGVLTALWLMLTAGSKVRLGSRWNLFSAVALQLGLMCWLIIWPFLKFWNAVE